MKILYHHRIASKDGQYVHIEEIVGALRGLGHEVIMAEPAAINRKAFGESSNLVSRIRSSLPDFVHELIEFAYSFIDYFRLQRLIKRYQPDCIYERYNLFFPSGIWAKQQFNLPLLLEVNAPLFEERSRHGHISLNKLAMWSEKYVWTHADFVLPVTQVLANKVATCGVPSDRLVVIPNGINRRQFTMPLAMQDVKEKLGFNGKSILGFVGFAREWHGLDRVLDVISKNQLSDWMLLVVGDGPVRKSLESKAERLGISDSIHFTGVVTRDAIPDYVSCFDVALQPDVVEYASPLKLFEYLALGKPVLAPDRDNIREVLTNGENALLFDANSARDFQHKLITLCESQTLRDQLAIAARKLVEDRGYYWDENGKKIVTLFEAILGIENPISATSKVS